MEESVTLAANARAKALAAEGRDILSLTWVNLTCDSKNIQEAAVHRSKMVGLAFIR